MILGKDRGQQDNNRRLLFGTRAFMHLNSGCGEHSVARVTSDLPGLRGEGLDTLGTLAMIVRIADSERDSQREGSARTHAARGKLV